jgi:hypothetical protein
MAEGFLGDAVREAITELRSPNRSAYLISSWRYIAVLQAASNREGIFRRVRAAIRLAALAEREIVPPGEPRLCLTVRQRP